MIKRLYANSLRKKVAREAALLLYTQQEKEFKQAKERAAKTLGSRFLPTNFEVAEELDLIAEEFEGEERRKRLISMRKEALRVMEALAYFQPRLIGSVWRGTVNKNSDIDIVVFSQDKEIVLKVLTEMNFKVIGVETAPSAKNGSGETHHIFVEIPSKNKVEIIVKKPEDIDREEICDIYGDPKRGLSINQLKEVLERDPLKRFIPKRKVKMQNILTLFSYSIV